MAERTVNQPRRPEIIGTALTLEPVAVDMANGKFLPFANLPQFFLSDEIELYANHTSALTQADPEKRERDAILHVRTRDKGFLYPHNPLAGTPNRTNPMSWTISKDPSILLPSIHIHSHSTDIAPSPLGGDMTVLLSGIGGTENYRDYYMPPAILVATPEHNYLMIKSAETSTTDSRHTQQTKQYDRIDFDEKARYIDYAEIVGHPVDKATEKVIQKIENETLGGDSLEDHYDNFTSAWNLSEAYHLGFYRSTKNGFYVRLTREMIMEQLMQTREEVARAVKTRLAQPNP